MLDYSTQLLEISSTQKQTQMSEYRVLDARRWNHYLHSPNTSRDLTSPNLN